MRDLAELVEPFVYEPLRPPPTLDALQTRAVAIRRTRNVRRLVLGGTAVAVVAAATLTLGLSAAPKATTVRVPPSTAAAATVPPLHADLGPHPLRVGGHGQSGYVSANDAQAAANPGVLVPARDASGTLIGYWNGDLGLLPRPLVESPAALAAYEACHNQLEQIMSSVSEINAGSRVTRACTATLTAQGDTVPSRFVAGGAGGAGQATTTVPTLIGADASTAQQLLSDLGFFATVDTNPAPSPGVPRNTVTGETPLPGTRVPINGAIRITINP